MGPTLAYADVLTDLAGSASTGSGVYTWPMKTGFCFARVHACEFKSFFFFEFLSRHFFYLTF